MDNKRSTSVAECSPSIQQVVPYVRRSCVGRFAMFMTHPPAAAGPGHCTHAHPYGRGFLASADVRRWAKWLMGYICAVLALCCSMLFCAFDAGRKSIRRPVQAHIISKRIIILFSSTSTTTIHQSTIAHHSKVNKLCQVLSKLTVNMSPWYVRHNSSPTKIEPCDELTLGQLLLHLLLLRHLRQLLLHELRRTLSSFPELAWANSPRFFFSSHLSPLANPPCIALNIKSLRGPRDRKSTWVLTGTSHGSIKPMA